MTPGVQRQFSSHMACILFLSIPQKPTDVHPFQECIYMYNVYRQGPSGNPGFFIFKMRLIILSPLRIVGAA